MTFFCVQANAIESLSYSGRLVQTNGAPVTGTVALRAELAYTDALGTILCTDDIAGVVLSKGVFHVKLDFACTGGKTLTQVLSQAPANESVAIQITDMTNSKSYSFQAIHAVPFSNVSKVAVQLDQNGAGDGEFLKWDNSTKQWKPGTVSGATGGTVTSVSASGPLSVTTPTSTPAISIAQANATTSGYLSSADWNTFNGKEGIVAGGTSAQYYRGDKSWQTLDTSVVPENVNLYFTNARALGVPLTGFVTAVGAIVASDSTLAAFGKAQGQINAINSAAANFLVKNSTDSITGVVNVGTTGLLQLIYAPVGLNDATNKAYVDSEVGNKVSKSGDTVTGVLTLDNDLRLKGGSNHVTVKGHATSAIYNFTLPQTAGTAGYVLSTDGSGNTSWVTSAVGSSTITDGSIVDADVNVSAGISQSKIANLTTDLAAKVSTTLSSGNIFVGNGSNVATGVAVSGDATISNTGVLALANTAVTAGTYSSVTVDGKGRVTGGTNPAVVNSLGVTAPITNSGTASAPVIAMAAATTSVNGYLTSTDWNAFNNKQAAINSASTITTGSVTTSLQSGVNLNPFGVAAGNTGEIRFYELAAGGTNYTSLKAPDALGANINYVLPSVAPTAGQVLSSTAAGVMSWTTIPSAPVSTVFGRSGAVVATAGDYSAAQVSYSPAGNIAATTVQAALDEIDSEKQGLITAGTTAQYYRGDKTFVDFGTDVRATALTGFAAGANTALAATDTTLTAFGKVQGQINATNTAVSGKEPAITAGTTAQYIRGDKTLSTFATDAINSVLSTFALNGTSKPSVANTDSVVGAFGKVQKFINDINSDYVSKSANQTINGSLAINSVTGFITVPTPVNPNDAANKSYVDGFGQWTKTGSDIYFNSGKVGVGTNAPQSTFEVSGGVGDALFTISADTDNNGENDNPRISLIQDGTGATSTGMEIGFSGEDTASSGNIFSLAKRWGGAVDWNTFNINTQNGYVGIGTFAPVETLHVNGSFRAGSGTNIFKYNGAADVIFTYPPRGSGGRALVHDTGNTQVLNYNGDFTGGLRIDGVGPTSNFFVSAAANGFVGVGTSAPATLFHMTSPTNAYQTIERPAGGFGIIQYSTLGSGRRWEMGVESTAETGTNTGSNFGIWRYSDAGAQSQVLSINRATGSVGINTASPTGVFSVDGGAGVLSLKPGTLDHTYLQLFARTASPSTRSGYIGYPGSASNLLNIVNEISGGHINLITSGGGYVGIGTTTPTSLLTVNGGAEINSIIGGRTNGAGNFHLDAWNSGADRSVYLNWSSGTGGAKVGNGFAAYGPAYASSFNVSSDRRLKENIKPIDHALEKVLQLNGVTFNWKDEKRNEIEGERIGLIAQDVEKVFPQAVKRDHGENTLPGGTRVVSYPDLVSPLMAAVKEFYSYWFNDSQKLHATVDRQAREIASKADQTALELSNAKIKKLESENAELKARLDKIERALNKK